MAASNFERLIQLADEVFAVKNDPDQLDVNEEVLAHLRAIHPATVSELDNGDGPVAWVLIIPTTQKLMQHFLANEISEKQLYELSPVGAGYDAAYLCSALVLEEYRRKGVAGRLALDAIKEIQKNHPLKYLFVWAFTHEGNLCASSIARSAGLPLLTRDKI